MKIGTPYTFIDLFAGIGGIRIGFEDAGCKCVFSSEYDKFAQQTYLAFFGEKPDFSDIIHVLPPGDITKLPLELVPDHNILTAGFPCQPFSLAGVSKKNSLGRPHGFDDPTQGTLFFNIKEILNEKQPDAFFLENVKNLQSHDKGNTYRIIINTLEGLGYKVFSRTIDAAGWLPQHRERIYLVGFKDYGNEPNNGNLEFSEFDNLQPPVVRPVSLEEILEEHVPEKYTLTSGTWKALQKHKLRHMMNSQGFGYGLIKKPFEGKVTRTLTARYYKDGAEILIDQHGRNPRRLTPLECARLMGFPEDMQEYFKRSSALIQPVSDNQAYRQFGNSVAIPVVNEIAKIMISKLNDISKKNNT